MPFLSHRHDNQLHNKLWSVSKAGIIVKSQTENGSWATCERLPPRTSGSRTTHKLHNSSHVCNALQMASRVSGALGGCPFFLLYYKLHVDRQTATPHIYFPQANPTQLHGWCSTEITDVRLVRQHADQPDVKSDDR